MFDTFERAWKRLVFFAFFVFIGANFPQKTNAFISPVLKSTYFKIKVHTSLWLIKV